MLHRLEKRLRPLCIRALKRVFIMCDQDMDGALKDAELNDFQLVCFGLALDAEELQNVKQVHTDIRTNNTQDAVCVLHACPSPLCTL